MILPVADGEYYSMLISSLIAAGSANLHRESIDWHNRVITNGGRVSVSTLKAVSNFCYKIDAAGIRDKFVRLNLFCGNGLSSVVVPLYKSKSFGGTIYGGNLDENNNFIGTDYTETGVGGGLKGGNGNGKTLDPYLTIGDCKQAGIDWSTNHIGFYITSTDTPTEYWIGGDDCYWGCIQGNTLMWYSDNGGYYGGGQGCGDHGILTTSLNHNGFMLGTYRTINTGDTYRNGVSITSSNGVQGQNGGFATNDSTGLIIMGTRYTQEDCTTFEQDTGATSGGYSIGLGLSASECLSYNNIMQAFQTSLGRERL